MIELVWLVPLLPLGAAILIALRGARPRFAAGAAWIGVAVAAVLCVGALVDVAHGARFAGGIPWLRTAGLDFWLAVRVDPLAAITIATVGVISMAVFAYAAEYMRGERGYARFFGLLSLFVGAMLTLVIADDVLLLFAAWEVVGLCSYLLIGFWFERPGVPRAANQAFIVTRVGDAALLVGVLLLAKAVGSGSISGMLAAVDAGAVSPDLLRLTSALLLVGAMGKSAQVPLHGWLPDAMAGPTPVSALIHSATMVAAGVYLVARFFPLLDAAGMLAPAAWIGALTALVGAAAALVQTDLKRLLAYSTMSQLGLMFVGLGAGSLVAGLLLLVGQAFFKSLLFLGAGVVDHGVHTTDLRRLGGLRERMPVTFALMALGAAALAGLPIAPAWPAKDATLAAAWERSPALFVAALGASLLTALYAARLVALVFLGSPREPMAARAGETRWGLAAPMAVLGALLVVVAAADAPTFGRPVERLLEATTTESPIATGLALAAAVAGVVAGVLVFARRAQAVLRAPSIPARWAERGFGVPALYEAIARSSIRVTDAAALFERSVFDPLGTKLARGVRSLVIRLRGLDARTFDRAGVVVSHAARKAVTSLRAVDLAVFERPLTRLAQATRTLVAAGNRFDVRRLDAAFDAAAVSLGRLGEQARSLQTGRVYNYFVSIAGWTVGALALAALAALIGSAD